MAAHDPCPQPLLPQGPAPALPPPKAQPAAVKFPDHSPVKDNLRRLSWTQAKYQRRSELMQGARPPPKPIASSEHGSAFSAFKAKEAAAEAAKAEDVFSPAWRPPKFDVRAADYGRPKHGSLTEQRGIAAGHHIGREIITLCEVITEYGQEVDDGVYGITFGQLFGVYQYISDKVVGMLLRARKHGLVAFQGEMLYQRRDEDVPVFLLKPLRQVWSKPSYLVANTKEELKVRALYQETDDPASCLAR